MDRLPINPIEGPVPVSVIDLCPNELKRLGAGYFREQLGRAVLWLSEWNRCSLLFGRWLLTLWFWRVFMKVKFGGIDGDIVFNAYYFYFNCSLRGFRNSREATIIPSTF